MCLERTFSSTALVTEQTSAAGGHTCWRCLTYAQGEVVVCPASAPCRGGSLGKGPLEWDREQGLQPWCCTRAVPSLFLSQLSRDLGASHVSTSVHLQTGQWSLPSSSAASPRFEAAPRHDPPASCVCPHAPYLCPCACQSYLPCATWSLMSVAHAPGAQPRSRPAWPGGTGSGSPSCPRQ